MITRRFTGASPVGLVLLAGALLLLAPAGASAARLVGGRRQTALERAFNATAAHRARLIVSIRSSTVSPAWAVVRSVAAPKAGRTSGGAGSLRLTSAYYHQVGSRQRPGSPPAKVRADLNRTFRVAVVYSGTGTEAIASNPAYAGVCAGAGGFIDQETVSVSPMSWTVRYVVNLDDVLGAARGAQGSAIVPAVTFAGGASRVSAVERLSRVVQDVSCNGKATRFTCTQTFHLGGPDPAGQLSADSGGGLEVGVPTRVTTSGACDPADYTLGPSLWDGGGATADAAHLKLFGGALPANPYAPVKVSWPAGSPLGGQGFAASPCQGDSTCSDAFRWSGTVRLQAAS